MIKKIVPNIKPGITLTFTKDSYLRGETSGWHTEGKILSVLKAGEKAKVIREVEYSPLKSGGFSVWAYVERE